jgi:death on curing protein
MYFLTPEQLRELNQRVIRLSGGASGAVNEANLEFICTRATTISKKTARVAAYYFYMLAASAHVFTDGNKRTAHMALEAFLLANGYRMDVNDAEFVGFALLTASGNKSREDVKDWLKGKVKRVKKNNRN